MFAEIITGRLGGIRHGFHKLLFHGPFFKIGRHIVHYQMYFPFADLPGSAADGDIFHGTAKAAHGMSFKMR